MDRVEEDLYPFNTEPMWIVRVVLTGTNAYAQLCIDPSKLYRH